MMEGHQASRHDTFLKKLRAARANAGLTQQQAARLIGKPQSFISKAETGERRLDFLELEELAQVYGVDVSFFSTMNPRRRR